MPSELVQNSGDPKTYLNETTGYPRDLVIDKWRSVEITSPVTISATLTATDFVNDSGLTFNVKSYGGAVGDGANDDTAAIQATFNAAIAARGSVEFPVGTWNITSTINLVSAQGMRVIGASAGDQSTSSLKWGGNATTPMFLMQDCHRTVWEHLVIKAVTPQNLLVGFQCENITGAGPTPRHNVWRDVVVDGVNGYITKACWYFPIGSGGDNNNDFNAFYDCVATNYLNCGWLFMSTQSMNNYFANCEILGNTNGQIGVSIGNDLQGATFLNSGSFFWYGGGGSHNQVADFYINTNLESSLISGYNGESSARLLMTGNSSGQWSPMTIEHIRWNHAGYLAADKKVIVYNAAGPFTLRNSQFNDTQIAAAWNAMQFGINSGGAARSQYRFESVYLETTASSLYAVTGGVALNDVVVEQCKKYDHATYSEFPNQVAPPPVISKSANYVLTAQDEIVLVDATGGARTITLPAVTGANSVPLGKQYVVKKIDASANTVTLSRAGAATIDGATTVVLAAQWAKVAVANDGTNWPVIG